MADTDEQIDFTEAFARLSDLGDAPITPTTLTAAPEAPATPETPAVETPAAEAPAPEAPAPEAPAPEPLNDNDLLARMAALVRQVPTEEAPTRNDAPETPADDVAPLTAEESETLNKYLEEWPEVAQAEALIRRREYHHVVQHVFRQVSAVLQPLEQTISALAAQHQYQQLQQQIPDYEDGLRDKVSAWAKEQPAYLQDAFLSVIDKGTPAEVADLVARYRSSVGSAAPVSAPAPAPAAPKKSDTELPADAKQAAASLAPVSSKRSAVAATSVPSDFDSAFATFAST